MDHQANVHRHRLAEKQVKKQQNGQRANSIIVAQSLYSAARAATAAQPSPPLPPLRPPPPPDVVALTAEAHAHLAAAAAHPRDSALAVKALASSKALTAALEAQVSQGSGPSGRKGNHWRRRGTPRKGGHLPPERSHAGRGVRQPGTPLT